MSIGEDMQTDIFGHNSVTFTRSAGDVEGFVKLPPAVQRTLPEARSFDEWRDEHGIPKRKNICIQNYAGSWVLAAGHLSRLGVKEHLVFQAPKTDEVNGNLRPMLCDREERIYNLPIYKSGYSTIREMFAQIDGADSRAALVPQVRHVNDLARKFHFVVLRSPESRLKSFYADKFETPEGTPNWHNYLVPYSELMGDLHPLEFLLFLSKVPSSFSDRHWRSAVDTIVYKDRSLVSAAYSINRFPLLFNHVSEQLNVSVEHVRENNTSKRPLSEFAKLFFTDALSQPIGEVYSRDCDLWAAVEAANGRLSGSALRDAVLALQPG